MKTVKAVLLSGTVFFLLFLQTSYAAELQKITKTQVDGIGVSNLSDLLNLPSAYQLSKQNTVLVGHKSLIKLKQQYNGVPVWNSHLVAEKVNGHYKLLSGQIVTGIAIDLSRMDTNVQAAKLKDSAYKLAGVNSDATLQSQKKIIFLDDKKKARLAYRFVFLQEGERVTRPNIIMDANNGELIKQWDGLAFNYLAQGPGGNIKTGKYEYGDKYPGLPVDESFGTCYMQDFNKFLIIWDMKNQNAGGSIMSFPCPRNEYKEINEAFSPINDALFFSDSTLNLYKNWFDYIYPNAYVRVHYGDGYENAFWNGSSTNYGDGKTLFYPLTGLDVVAHEMGHAFTEYHSDLVYSGMSGGINESYSDIIGEAAELYVNGVNDWVVGKEIVKDEGADSVLRYFEDPTLDGHSIGHAKDYTAGLDVHYSSGVFNKAFFLLANKPNWGVKKAAQTFTLANQIYWPQDSTFEQGAFGVAQAAMALDYSGSDVCDVFSSVGVNCNNSQPNYMVINNGDTVRFSGKPHQARYFKIHVPEAAKQLTITTTGYSVGSDLALYVKADATPSLENFDCKAEHSGANLRCTLDVHSIAEADFNILLNSRTAYSDVSLSATHDAGDTQLGTIISGLMRSTKYFKFYSSSGKKIISISGGKGDADLYVKRNQVPTGSDFDCRPFELGNNESCEVNEEGTYHVMVVGFKEYKDVYLKTS